ncbi:MAG: polysaccharide deacetylase family protein [Actinomycetota bacterium]
MVNFLVDKLPRYFLPTWTIRKKRFISFLLAFLLTLFSYRVIVEIFTVRIPIFGFHDLVDFQNPKEFSPQKPGFVSDYPIQDLEIFLERLVQDNYWFLSTQELYDYFLANPKKTIPLEHQNQKKVMLTFDDGYKSLQTHLLPILEKLENKYRKKIKVVVFINPGFLGHRGVVLEKVTCQDLREGLQKGFYDVQSHGLNHQDLTKISVKELERELSEAQHQLRKCTQDLDPNHLVASHLAYPFGAINKFAENYVSRYYLSGYIYNSLTLKLRGNIDRYHISRLTINQKKSVKKLIRLAAGGWLHGLLGNRILELL